MVYKEMETKKEHSWRGRLLQFFIKFFIAPLVRLIWLKRVEGRENIPGSGAYIVAANHQSYFDFISLISVWPNKLTFLAAEKFFTSRFWQPIVEYTGQIKVERQAVDKSESFNRALEALKSGRVLAIFPQGTRSRSGEIEKTYAGVARLALIAGAPIVPVGIRGAFEVLPPQASRPKAKKIIELHIGAPMSFTGRENTPGTERAITDEAMRQIARLAGKEYKGG